MLEIYLPSGIYSLATLDISQEQSLLFYLFYHFQSYSNSEIQNCQAAMTDNIFKAF